MPKKIKKPIEEKVITWKINEEEKQQLIYGLECVLKEAEKYDPPVRMMYVPYFELHARLTKGE